MKRIKHFKKFINENYDTEQSLEEADGLFSKISNWASNLIKKIKSGFVKKIPAGPKKGLPMVMYFAHGEGGSIQQQMTNYFASTEYGEKTNESAESAVLKDLSPYLKYDPNDPISDYTPRNVDAEKIFNMIIQRYNYLQTKVPTKKKRGGEEITTMETGYGKPPFIFGAPGIGKTEMVAQAADELGVDLLFIDLQFMEPSDLLGLPSQVELKADPIKDPYGKGVTRGNPPIFLPATNDGKNYKDKGGIVFLDEVNRANPIVLQSVMQFFQQRRIQDYVLPDKWLIVAAGNRPGDDEEGKIAKLSPAELRRVTAVNFVPSIEGLMKHVQGVDPKTGKPTRSYDYVPSGTYGEPLRKVVMPELLAFLKTNPEWFHTLTPEIAKEGRMYASPAQWIDASKSLFNANRAAKAAGTVISPEEARDIFADEVGGAAADAFFMFYKTIKDFPVEDLEKVYNDPANAPVPKNTDDPPTIWGKMVAVANHANDIEKDNPDGKLTPQQFSNCVDWMDKMGESLAPDGSDYAMAFWSILVTKTPSPDGRPGSYLTKETRYTKSLERLHSSLFKDIVEFIPRDQK